MGHHRAGLRPGLWGGGGLPPVRPTVGDRSVRQAYRTARKGCVQHPHVERASVAALEGGLLVLKENPMFWIIVAAIVLFLIFATPS